MSDYAGAQWMPSPGRYWQGRLGGRPRYIIVHGTAGGANARAMGNWLNTQTERDPTSVHYVIGTDGQIVQLVAEADSAWGNGVLTAGHEAFWSQVSPQHNPNWITISIEHCKPSSDNADHLTPAQQRASFHLIADICRRHSIPPQRADARGGITSHASIDPVNRSDCPGPYPWDELFAYLRADPTQHGDGGLAPGVPSGWSDDGKNLHANGHTLRVGMREMVLAGWDAANVPFSDEIYTTPCDPTDQHSGEGSRVYFRDCIAVWQKATNHIYRVQHLGAYVKQLEDRIAALTTPTPAPTTTSPATTTPDTPAPAVSPDASSRAT